MLREKYDFKKPDRRVEPRRPIWEEQTHLVARVEGHSCVVVLVPEVGENNLVYSSVAPVLASEGLDPEGYIEKSSGSELRKRRSIVAV